MKQAIKRVPYLPRTSMEDAFRAIRVSGHPLEKTILRVIPRWRKNLSGWGVIRKGK